MAHLNAAVIDLSEIIESRTKSPLKGCAGYDIFPILQRVSEIMNGNLAIRNVALNISCTPQNASANLNFRSVVRMLIHLISHELATPDANCSLNLSASCTDEYVEFSLSGSGVNESAEHISFLKNPVYEDMDAIFSRYGTDLYLVRRLASFYDGTLRIENTDLGRVITVKLPHTQIKPHVRQATELDFVFGSSWIDLL